MTGHAGMTFVLKFTSIGLIHFYRVKIQHEKLKSCYGWSPHYQSASLDTTHNLLQ